MSYYFLDSCDWEYFPTNQ